MSSLLKTIILFQAPLVWMAVGCGVSPQPHQATTEERISGSIMFSNGSTTDYSVHFYFKKTLSEAGSSTKSCNLQSYSVRIKNKSKCLGNPFTYTFTFSFKNNPFKDWGINKLNSLVNQTEKIDSPLALEYSAVKVPSDVEIQRHEVTQYVNACLTINTDSLDTLRDDLYGSESDNGRLNDIHDGLASSESASSFSTDSSSYSSSPASPQKGTHFQASQVYVQKNTVVVTLKADHPIIRSKDRFRGTITLSSYNSPSVHEVKIPVDFQASSNTAPQYYDEDSGKSY